MVFGMASLCESGGGLPKKKNFFDQHLLFTKKFSILAPDCKQIGSKHRKTGTRMGAKV
jgi:hypothetical protein